MLNPPRLNPKLLAFDALFKKDAVVPSLPMPHAPDMAKKVSLGEFRQYHRRRAAHLSHFPDYDAGFNRPTPVTAEAIWQLLAPDLPESTLADYSYQHSGLSNDERKVIALAVLVLLIRGRLVTDVGLKPVVSHRTTERGRSTPGHGRASRECQSQ